MRLAIKAIAFSPSALALLQAAGVEADDGVVPLAGTAVFLEVAATRQFDREASVRTLA